MADEEGFLEEDVAAGQDLEVGQKIGFLPAIAIKILKWAAVGIAAIIFIVTVVFITMRILNRGTQPQTLPTVSPSYESTPPILSTYPIEEIRTRTADDNPSTVIAKIILGYDENNKAIQTELTKRRTQIKDLTRSYFSSKTEKDLHPKNDEQLKVELLDRINRILVQGKVREIYFDEKNVVSF